MKKQRKEQNSSKDWPVRNKLEQKCKLKLPKLEQTLKPLDLPKRKLLKLLQKNLDLLLRNWLRRKKNRELLQN